ncbi:MAG: alpha-2-macroglobulin family protein [Chitinophagaceae bacterium]|nr:MAG: alpha-2-macroglobulin family protein [Chitinophagaceae bacterium]
MRNRILLSALFAAALLFTACKRNSVSLDYTSAKGEVPRLGNLVFRFSKSLAPDSLLNNWDSTGYVTFEPAIPGRFRWEAPDELVFSPATGLAPATNYTARVHEDVLRFSKFNDIEGAGDIRFHTPALQLADAQVTWVLDEEGSRSAVPQVALSFNYAVKPEALKDKLRVQVEGKEHPFQLVGNDSRGTVLLRLGGFKGEDRSYDAAITVEKGLLPEGGHAPTTGPLKAQLTIQSPYLLQVNNVESEHDGTEGVVRVYTSQQLTGESVASYVRFEPSVKYTVEYTDRGMALHSEAFNTESSYTLTISPGLRGRIGGVLREESSSQVAFGELEPSISFTNSKALYLSKRGSGNIEVRVSGVPRVRLVISKIYENNILAVRRSGYSPRSEDVEPQQAALNENSDAEGESESYYDESTGGDVIYTKEIDTRSLPKSGAGRVLNLSQYSDRLPEFKGIYHVELRSAKDYWVSDSRLISSSDIGLIAKQGADKLYVFANSIQTAAAQSGVTVNVYGQNNQLLGTGSTNAQGVAELSLVKRGPSGFRPALIIARTGDDLNYLPFNSTRVATSRFDVGGKRLGPAGLDAFVWAERDIYRPGEQVHFAVALRDRVWKSPGTIPVRLRIVQPNGKDFRTLLKSLNEGGVAEASVDIPVSALTGSYTLEVSTTNDILLATKNFSVEEFLPDRIKVSAKLDKEQYVPGEAARLSINAVNFFGPPAANRNYELEVQLRGRTFNPKNFSDYDFSLTEAGSLAQKEVKEGKTDASGNAAESYEVPTLYANTGLLQASFFTTVFDETGRPVARKTVADVFTQDIFHGVKDDGYYYYALNQPASFRLVSVSKAGSAVNASARVVVIKHEYRTVLARSGSYFRYESQQQDKTLHDRELAVGGGSTFAFVPRSPGDYELRVYRPGASAYVSKRFYSYGSWSSGGGDAFAVNTEGQVSIELDKEGYKTGESARVLFKTPFSGRMLVTVERDGLLSYEYIDVAQRSASMELKLNGAHVPNVYVTATLFKPHSVSDIPLTVAHGFKNLKVEEAGRRLGVRIAAAASSRSNRRQTVQVKAAPNSWVTLAAVDNGVLQVTGFETPDPYGYYYQKRALDVQAYDIYPLLFPELRGRLSSTGGDGSNDMSKRTNPMPAKRVKILSYWSGVRKTDGSGNASFSFEVPQFSGQVRLMAVALSGDRFGNAESTLTVADPLVISTALPRFLSPGDTALVPVTLTNTTSRSSTGSATLTLSGPLAAASATSQPVTLAPSSEARVYFKVTGASLGVGKAIVKVNTLGETFTDATEISVRPPSTLQQRSGSGSVAGGASVRVPLPEGDFLPGSSSWQLLVSRSPVVELADQLRWLVEYPYGCSEQTVSSAFPQLYYGDLAALVNDRGDGKGNANANVLEAIRKIRMRQLYNGAVTLWDGEQEEDWWVTVYAAHFLLEARKAGFEVENGLLEPMLGYLQNKLKSRSYITYYFNRTQTRRIAPKEVPYSLYVLALAGRANVSAMNYYKANPDQLALDGKYLLSAAYAVAGDKRSFGAFLPRAFSGEVSVPQTGGSFYSEARDEALALNALLEVDPGNVQVPVMAQHVGARLKSQRYLNTQERVFSFLALGKLARANAGSTASAEIRVGGKVVAKVGTGAWKGTGKQLGSGPVEVSTSGSGRMYYSWVAEGISRSGAYTEEDSYVKVRRTYFDRYGSRIAGNSFRQNELVIVALTVERAYSNEIDNIVLTDLLPAGFEIENPRTRELPGMEWIKNASEPTQLDVRDDRIHFFIDLRNNVQTYYYAVRAVSPGTYRQGPASADAMYRGEIHSYHGGGTIRVLAQ